MKLIKIQLKGSKWNKIKLTAIDRNKNESNELNCNITKVNLMK